MSNKAQHVTTLFCALRIQGCSELAENAFNEFPILVEPGGGFEAL
jgi:hypothetical protein